MMKKIIMKINNYHENEYYNLKNNSQTQINMNFKEFLLKNKNLIKINYYDNEINCILF